MENDIRDNIIALDIEWNDRVDRKQISIISGFVRQLKDSIFSPPLFTLLFSLSTYFFNVQPAVSSYLISTFSAASPSVSVRPLSFPFFLFSSHCQLPMQILSPSPLDIFAILPPQFIHIKRLLKLQRLSGSLPGQRNQIRRVSAPFFSLSLSSSFLPCLYQFYKRRTTSNPVYIFDGSSLNPR